MDNIVKYLSEETYMHREMDLSEHLTLYQWLEGWGFVLT